MIILIDDSFQDVEVAAKYRTEENNGSINESLNAYHSCSNSSENLNDSVKGNDSFEDELSEISDTDLDYIIEEIITEFKGNDNVDAEIDINEGISIDQEFVDGENAERDEFIHEQNTASYVINEEPARELDDQFVSFIIRSAKYQLKKIMLALQPTVMKR